MKSLSVAALFAVITGSVVAGFFGVRQDIVQANQRFEKAVVDKVSAEESAVFFVDEAGECWCAEVENVQDFIPGDKYVLTFDDMGTPDIYDDMIVDIF